MTGGRKKSLRRGPLDSWLVRAFVEEAGADGCRYFLAATLAEIEADRRQDQFGALSVVLDFVVDGRLVWPEDPDELRHLVLVLSTLGWLDPLGDNPGDGAMPGEDGKP